MTRKLTGFAASLLIGAFPCLPLTTQGQIITDAESELRVVWMQMKRELPRHPSEAVQRYAQCIAWAIIDQVPEEFHDLSWEVIVFDTGALNASVTPEGKIAIFSGLLEVADTPDKLAAVLGHEVAHLTQGHVSERVGRMAMTGIAGVIAGTVTGFGAESMTAAEVVLQLPYQRGQETEADIVGMTFMANAGYNPASVLALWRDMAGSGGGERQPEWLSTHPDPELRRQEMAGNLAPALKTYNDALDSGVRPRCHL
jgi:predicted Zn-dependent protease